MDRLQDDEREKYEKVWTYDFYRSQADGDPLVDMAYQKMGCQLGERLIDWGCGKGTPAAQFKDRGLNVLGIDIAHNCLDQGIDIPLIVSSLWDVDAILAGVHKHWGQTMADYSFCTDVLEHIPPDRIDDVVFNIRDFTKKAAFIQVCTVADTSGRKMDPPMKLHLTVEPYEWWRVKLKKWWAFVHGEPRGKSRGFFVCR